MKQCSRCKLLKSDEDFHRWKRSADGRQSMCKLCRKANDRERYQANPKLHSQVREARRHILAEWAQGLKQNEPCVDCGGYFHWVAMQWDHVGTDKAANVSDMVKGGLSRKRILAEIAKCELVCANCHAVRTFMRRRHVAQLG